MTEHKKSVLITGCSSGIGRCLAHLLHDRGYRVHATVRRQRDQAALADAGLHAVLLDLTDSSSIRRVVDQVGHASDGELFALVNNAAYAQPGAVEDLSREALRQQFETNVFGTHELTTRFLPAMRRGGGGRIIQISSILGLMCLRYRGAYAASKYALEALTDSMRLELASTGLHLSLIEPGPIHSRFRANSAIALHAHINVEDSAYRNTYASMERHLTKPQPLPFSLPPHAVARKVIHALESRRPRLRYRVTTPAHVLAACKRWLPDRVFHHLISRLIPE